MDSRRFKQLKEAGVFKDNAPTGKASARTVERKSSRRRPLQMKWLTVWIRKDPESGRHFIDRSSRGTYIRAIHGNVGIGRAEFN